MARPVILATCAVPGCAEGIARPAVFCRCHWRRLTAEERTAIANAWSLDRKRFDRLVREAARSMAPV